MALKIGLVGVVGQEMKQDPWATLKRIAEIGYEGIEGVAGVAPQVGVSVPELRDKLQSMGLRASGMGSIRLEMTDEVIDEAIAAARDIGSDYIMDYWEPSNDEEELLRNAEYYNRVGKRCRQEGIRFCYHNHDHEMKQFNGKRALEILLDNTDPEHLFAELDVAWVTYGGADPVELIRKYAGRCPVLHMKDFLRLEPGCETAEGNRKATQFTEVGTGVVNTAGVVEAARTCGVEWLTVEQDRPRDLAPLDSIQVSFDNLKALVG